MKKDGLATVPNEREGPYQVEHLIYHVGNVPCDAWLEPRDELSFPREAGKRGTFCGGRRGTLRTS